MITTIHFEGNEYIKCSYENNQIIEHLPAKMHESWDYYVKEEIQKKGQNDEIFLGVLLDDATKEDVVALETMRKMYHLSKKQLRLFTKEEAFLGWMEYDTTWLDIGNAGLFDYGKSGLFYYLIENNGDKLSIRKTDVSKYMELSKEEKDIPFLSAVKEVLATGVTSVVYLFGQEFQGNWMNESAKVLCNGRRVFMGDHIFAQGMIGFYLAERKKGESHDPLILTQNGTRYNIYLQLYDGRNQMSVLMLKEGTSWMTSKNEMTIVAQQIEELKVMIQSPRTGDKNIVAIKMLGAPKEVTKYRVEAEYISKEQCRIKIYNLGFGRIREASHQVYEQIILLDEAVSEHA